MDDFLKELQETFLLESQDLLLTVESLFLKLEKNSSDFEVFVELSRLAHNFKGSGKAVGFDHISIFSHQLENLLLACKKQELVATPLIINLLFRSVDALKNDIENLRTGGASKDYSGLLSEITSALKKEKPLKTQIMNVIQPHAEVKTKTLAAEYLRIPALRIESLIDALGEQVILQSALEQSKTDLVKNEDLILKTIAQLSKLTFDLQRTVMSLRMVSLNPLFSKLERAARDAALSLAKPIAFVSNGKDQEIDKTIADSLSDALTHMVRNAVDHGIETSAERASAGKPIEGQISVIGFRLGGSFVIEIKDDGRGLDSGKILEKAKKVGLAGSETQLSEKQIFEFIFENGFSTKDNATDISGRGVGMNVVKEKIQELKGTYEIESKVGFGSTFRIHLPLTLAIFNAMIIKVGCEKFIIPNSDVDEVSRIEIDKFNDAKGFLQIRDQIYSVVDLRQELFGEASEGRNSQLTALLIRRNKRPFALIVDEVLSIQKIVHKAVSQDVKQVRGSAGASILGDGSVCLILNITHFAPKFGPIDKAV